MPDSNKKIRTFPSAREKRMVLYEELAEYYYNIAATSRLKYSNVDIEAQYHVKNLILLSLYFDCILIASATIYNVRDEFVSKVITSLLTHSRVREMLQIGTLKIVGWGGGKSQEMFESATEYAGSVLGIKKNSKELATIKSIFDNSHVISRSQDMPDQNLAEKYKERLSSTTYIRNKEQIEKVFSVVDEQYALTGSLIAIEMIPSLEKAQLTQDILDASKLELFGVTMEHMKNEIPNIWVYSPFLAATFNTELAHTASGSPRSFLLSPILFGNFLSGYIDGKTFQHLVNKSYYKLHKLKNGDWEQFKEAYHQAVVEVSNTLELGMHLSGEELVKLDANQWAERVVAQIQVCKAELDFTVFIESLASLGSAVLAVPFIQPLAKLFGALLGKRMSNRINAINENRRSNISPFILKVERAYIM